MEVPLEVEWSSRLSEQEVPMPVSPLSDVMLCRRVWLLLPLGEATEECHNEPESHPGEGKSVPALKVFNPDP